MIVEGDGVRALGWGASKVVFINYGEIKWKTFSRGEMKCQTYSGENLMFSDIFFQTYL